MSTAAPRALRRTPPGVANWSVTAAYDLYRALVEGVTDYTCAVLERGDTPAEIAGDVAHWATVAARRDRPQWATPHRVVRETPVARVRDFTVGPRGRTVPTLVLPPQAGHDSCIVDFSAEQSQIGAMRAAGLHDLVSMDWVGATPATARMGIDDYLAVIDETVEDLGGRANVVGDCQGGWLATIYAALHPEKVHTLTLAGAPVDFHAGEPLISDFVSLLGPAGDLTFYQNVVALGSGVLPGEFLLNGFKAMQPAGEVERLLQLLVHVRDARHVERYGDFERWFQHTQDIPGAFYLWIVEHLFQRNELVRGELEVGGGRVDLGRIDCPLYLLGGATDHITPPGQVFALGDYASTPAADVHSVVAPGGHLGLFMGRTSLREHWPPILRDIARRSQLRAGDVAANGSG